MLYKSFVIYVKGQYTEGSDRGVLEAVSYVCYRAVYLSCSYRVLKAERS